MLVNDLLHAVFIQINENKTLILNLQLINGVKQYTYTEKAPEKRIFETAFTGVYNYLIKNNSNA